MYFVAKVDPEKCVGCKICIFNCPEPNAIVFDEKTKKVTVNVKRCKSCELCIEVCPKKAVASVLIAEVEAEKCKE